MNLELVERTVKEITLKDPLGQKDKFNVLQIFPFTSASKRMGIIVKHEQTGRIIFYLKGADSIMVNKIS